MSSNRFTPLMPSVNTEPTTAEQDWADFTRYLDGLAPWEKRFAKFMPKAQPDSLEAYIMTNGL